MEQFYFLIAVLVIGFLNWLVKIIQERKITDDAEKLRREMESLPPEIRAEVDRRNTQVQPKPQEHPSPRNRHPQAPPQEEQAPNPLREIMGELLGIPQQKKPVPPPLPHKTPAHKPQPEAQMETSRQRERNAEPRKVTNAELAAADAFRHADTKRERRKNGESAQGIRDIIAQTDGLRKAVVLREILGPPQSMKR
jgi:hypothetical protein